MPIYEYKCEKCGAVFETLVSVHSKNETICSKCGSKEIRKLISAAGIKISPDAGQQAVCRPRGGFS
jgi:putative FmdB family regulatory protein